MRERWTLQPARWALSRSTIVTMARLATLLVLAAACGPGPVNEEASDEAAQEERATPLGSTTDDTATDDEQDPATDAEGDPAAESPADPDLDDDPDAAPVDTGCQLPGRWRLRSDEFLAGLPGAGDQVSVEYVEGDYELVLDADGSVRMTRNAWSLRSRTGEGSVRVTISDLTTGAWSAADGVLNLDVVTEYSDVELALETEGGLTPLPGGTFNDVDVDAATGSGSYACTDRELEMTVEGVTTHWDRVG